MAKYVIENSNGEVCINWGKFTALLGLCGALAVDSVEAGYAEGVTEVVDTFGLIVEQVMGEWILSEGGGWEGFIRINQYEPMLPPVPRTIIILGLFIIILYFILSLVSVTLNEYFYSHESQEEIFWRKWGNIYPRVYCGPGNLRSLALFEQAVLTCPKPMNPLQYLYNLH